MEIATYGGWHARDVATIWGIPETKSTQAAAPWLRKAALLWSTDPSRCLAMIMHAAAELEPEELTGLNERMGFVDKFPPEIAEQLTDQQARFRRSLEVAGGR